MSSRLSTSSTLELEENTKSTGDSVPFARRTSSFQVRWSDEEFELYKILKSKKYPALHKKFEHYRKTNVATVVMYQFMIVSLKSMHGIRKKEVLLKLDNLLNEMETLGLPKDIEAYNSIFQVLQRYRLPNMIEKYLVDMDKNDIPKKYDDVQYTYKCIWKMSNVWPGKISIRRNGRRF